MIEIGKTYQTRCGWPVRIHATDLNATYSVLATVQHPDGDWESVHVTADGRYMPDGVIHDYDLIEVKQPIKFTLWVSVYRTKTLPDEYWTSWNYTKEAAEKVRSRNALMTVPVTITGREGDGL